ncbi:MAG TPA: HEAT repeat domain-containing protein, partial [Verrucomicrobiota bacterium]|nr:HEAT repeat domain-containing protein [Verrucomicrobiota bacterium]
MHRLLLSLAPLLAATGAAAGADLVEARGTGLRVPRGFMAERVADFAVAGEIHAFTLDRFGRGVVPGPGSLGRLGDQNLDRRADLAVLAAPVRTAGWGVAAAGPDIWWAGDDGLWRFRDADGDGRADGTGEKVLAITTGPNAAHALALGPDGFLHLGAGFATAFTNATHAGDPASPFVRFEAGAVLRSTGTERAEAWTVGLRNPRGLAFSTEGPLLAWDAEDPREAFLPWGLPTRLIEVPAGLRQGWLRAEEAGSWALPERQPDSTEALSRVADAVPGGLAVYRHAVLPGAWWGRVLAADTANARVLAFRLSPGTGGWTALAEVFVQGAPGTFFPLGIEVAPDGAVLIASGGRGTGAGVYRVAPLRPANDVLAAQAQLASERPIEGVLRAPQPLSAWSLEAWRPAAEALGGGAFLAAARDPRRPADERIRAIEVAAQLFGGLDETTAGALLQDVRPELRARAAWSLGVTGPPFLGRALAALLSDASPAVRREAAGVLLLRRHELPREAVAEWLGGLLADPDFRVRRIAVTLGDRLDEATWDGLWAQRGRRPLAAQLTLGFAALRRRGG